MNEECLDSGRKQHLTGTTVEIGKLHMSPKEINKKACMKYLPQITAVPKDRLEAEEVLQQIVEIIHKEIEFDADGGQVTANQTVLNLAFRAYYQLLHKHALEDTHFRNLLTNRLLQCNECDFQMLYAILQTEHAKQLNLQDLWTQCLAAKSLAAEQNSSAILYILKVLNLLCTKCAILDAELSLEHVYYCLQSGQCGLREETLILFTHCCKQPQRALQYFMLMTEFWPWTNRNKFYLLSCILTQHNLKDLIAAAKQKTTEFFAGIRLSLSYKSLLAASQYIVKSLSGQDCKELLELAVEILTRGTLSEIQNFYAQWFGRISQKDALFDLLQKQPEVARFLVDSSSSPDSTENYRLILIFSMFSRQIFAASKLHFFKISTELITNCFQFEIDAQLLILKFIVDNLSNFAIEDCLEFILAFVLQHKNVENAQFRNNILAKMPIIINYIAKTFNKLQTINDCTTLESSIKHFFQQLQNIIDTDISSVVYQPKIFALKLLEILLKSLYTQNLLKNAKNCSLTHNKHLGEFLIAQQIFDATHMSSKLLELLNDPLGFDDALELIVALLYQLQAANLRTSFSLCKRACESTDIDECALSALYAKVAMQSSHHVDARNTADELDLYQYAFDALDKQLEIFSKDPLHMCRNENHLFGYLCIINEILHDNFAFIPNHIADLLPLLNRILNTVLDLLNANKSTLTAASFQDMDESLELLVQQSALAIAVEKHEEQRKFLLMSFWLTLKGCCDLATTLGCILVTSVEEEEQLDLVALEQCIAINVAVLTRCRHKGAIEAAGVSIGKLTKCITSHLSTKSKAYTLLYNCLELLFDDGKLVSTTRRGAGFSIMFLHIVKNEAQRGRPILKRAIQQILQRLKTATIATNGVTNCDRMEALTLHYLCVLVKDTELRDATTCHYNEIMMAAIVLIDNADWTICNAALQLFGALIPKIVGQKQATEYTAPLAWEPSEVTFSDIQRRLPTICDYILRYCQRRKESGTSTRSIILFLGFFAKVEHLRKAADVATANDADCLLQRLRDLMWQLLRHNCEKVRQLAALCFIRAHEFRIDLPHALLAISKLLFSVKQENFFLGLIYTLSEGVAKMQNESMHTLEKPELCVCMQQLQQNLTENFMVNVKFKLYTRTKLLDLLLQLDCSQQSHVVSELLKMTAPVNSIGYDLWAQKKTEINN